MLYAICSEGWFSADRAARELIDMQRTSRRAILKSTAALAMGGASIRAARSSIPERAILLSFDDAVKSHRTFVGPFLRDLGFKATFFVTHLWMNDIANFMNWGEIAELHRMGYEIGNHAWTHANYSEPRIAARLAGELALTEYELGLVGVPRPVSFAWCGNNFGPEGLETLRRRRYKFARRGLPPEARYGTLDIGLVYNPAKNHPLLIPTTGDGYPSGTVEHFEQVIGRSRPGEIVVLQFHGVPDLAHPWVHTPPDQFIKYMRLLKARNFQTLTFRELQQFVDVEHPPLDPLEKVRYPRPRNGRLILAPEVESTRADLLYWLGNMSQHQYTLPEQAQVCGMAPAKFKSTLSALKPMPAPHPFQRFLPYPGGRSARSGCQEEAVSPLRGTKVSVFLPWDPRSYVVIDLPQAIRCNLGTIFLAHTHVPTIWNEQNITIENLDWDRLSDDSLQSQWGLPNAVGFGATVRMEDGRVKMEFSITNFSDKALSEIEISVCVMLKQASGFAEQAGRNMIFKAPVAGVKSADGKRAIFTAWEPNFRVRGNHNIPCIHSDARLLGCGRGETVRAAGSLWFE